MFHLTPQERFVLAALLTIVLVGSMVHFALSKQVPALQWVKNSQQSRKSRLPDINRADAAQLEKLPGIGPKTAQNIIAYRGTRGPFVRLDDLRQVKGITKTNYKKIAEAYAQP